MFGLNPLMLYLLAGLLFTNLFTLAAWRMASSEAEACQTARAHDTTKAKLAEAEQALEEAVATIEKNNEVLAVVAAQEAKIDRLTKEKADAVRKLTTGRRCLDGAAVRVLNAEAVPDPVSKPLPADAAFATDTDVGEWIAGARKAYDTCRARLDGIAAFYEVGQ